ncbi:MAG TPA: two-component regulator propeller domain-containing protein [Blastocatellia bacterium]|nr:two-component regulator propeller domain-containing protein [Blastocatellia bacterium]
MQRYNRAAEFIRQPEACRVSLRVLLPALLAVILAAEARGERLPVKSYGLADGLPHETVRRIIQDTHGFIWFCTPAGVSRFDGYRFTNYGANDGLTIVSTNDLIETRRGVYWVATNGGGVCRLNPRPEANSRFTVYRVGGEPETNRVNVLYEDRAGRLWAGTDAGLFVLDEEEGEFVRVSLQIEGQQDRLVQVWAFVEDRDGSLWIGSGAGLTRRMPDGRLLNYSVQVNERRNSVYALLLDPDERLWLGTRQGLIVLRPEPLSGAAARRFPWRQLDRSGASPKAQSAFRPLPDNPGDACLYTASDGMGGGDVRMLHRSADGVVRICGPESGLTEFSGGGFRHYTTAHGLSDESMLSVLEDRDGNLWMGTNSSGAMKLTRNGLITYDKADGLGHQTITAIFENPAAELYVTTGSSYINRFEGKRFTSVRPNLPQQIPDFRSALLDRAGEWWVATREGLFRFPRTKRLEQLAQAQPIAFYTKKDGLAEDNVTYLFEDSRGDIWIASWSPAEEVLTRWDRASGKFHRYSDRDGLPPFNPAFTFCEDAEKNLWIGFRNGGLARYRGGRFRTFTEDDGLPATTITRMLPTQPGRLWLTTGAGGLIRIDDASADDLNLAVYTTDEGLSSNHHYCLTDDDRGRIYIAVPLGIDRLDPASGEVKRYTVADGFPGLPRAAHRDRNGALWFGTSKGLVRLIPGPERPTSPSPVFISGVRVAGVPQAVSDFGEANVPELELEPEQGEIQIDFFAISFAAGESLQYQYKIEGTNQDWSAPTQQRTVNLSLSPGSYRFLVREVRAGGGLSPAPASVSFKILRPLWQRWWFIAMAAALLSLAAYTFYRYKVARLVELERVRTRIATDLHDDIGSNLSLIAMVSEVAKAQAPGDSPEIIERLALVARTSRQSVDAMSDIVWAVNPKRDHLHDLTERMRRFASDTFTARDIEFQFSAPGASQDIKLGADLRRQVYMVFKEGVNNIAKHSDCTQAVVELGIKSGHLILKLSDNGKGFDFDDASNGYGGNGLASMRRRAESVGGRIEIVSSRGAGTAITLKVRV